MDDDQAEAIIHPLFCSRLYNTKEDGWLVADRMGQRFTVRARYCSDVILTELSLMPQSWVYCFLGVE